MTTNRAGLALAVASSPLSLDQLLAWGLARPAELWTLLDEARREGWITEDVAAGRGSFAFADEGRRNQILDGASGEDFAALASIGELVPDLLATARRLRREQRFRPAGDIYRVLLAGVPAAAFPGGERGWLDALLESIRTFREMYGITAEMLDRAVAVAEAHGDLASQAVLLAARGHGAMAQGRLDEARRDFARAREAAESVDAAVRAEVYAYIAIGLFTQGRMREGVAAVEELLGDVPDDVVAGMVQDDSPAAGALIGLVADAYTVIGQHARGLELMHRFLALAEASGRPAMIAEAHVLFAIVLSHQGSLAAIPHADRAWSYFSEHQAEPLYVWFASLTRTWARGVEGRLEDMREALAAGLAARARSLRAPLSGTIPFDLDERLGPGALDGVAGFDLVHEAERTLGWPNVFGAGVAHRFLARHVGRGPAGVERDRRVGEHLEQAITLLREAGALPELARALADAAAHAERCGDAERARSLRAEEQQVRTALPQRSADAPGRDAQLAAVVLGLGRLDAWRERKTGLWGELAARLSQGLGIERVALAESGAAPRLLAVRGGDAAWRAEVVELARRPPSEVSFESTAGRRRIVVPFAAGGVEREGLAVLENEESPSLVSESDRALLAGLGVQLGVLYGNIVLWQELAAARERLEQENRYFRESAPAPFAAGIIAHSPAMVRVLELVTRVAPTPTTVLILGETGSGKELVAREVHRRSTRAGGPFIAVHIASLAPGLVTSGLFGHERGAFTGAVERAKGRFELADGGTIFLDEVGELSLEDQVRLLRVLQEGTFERVGGTKSIASDFRVVAATNRDLEAEVRAGRFREDLYFRLNVFPIRVPPLRERREEIPTLALMFCERFARNLGRTFEGISEADVGRLQAYPWPGNVRELEHLVERAVLLSDGPRLVIPPLEGAASPEPHATAAAPESWPTLEEAERTYIARVLEHTRGRITGAGGAAEILALNPSTLNWRIEKLGLRDGLARARGEARAKRRRERGS